MKSLFTILFSVFILGLSAQNMLVLEKPGTVKNYIFYAGNNISLKTKDGLKINGPINIIRDSNMVVDFKHELRLDDIAIVYKSRHLMGLFGTAFMAGSLLYIGLDIVNGANYSQKLSENQSLLTAFGVFGVGTGLLLFSKKKMTIDDKKWRLKILKKL